MKSRKIILIFSLVCFTFYCCEKVEEGFLSDNFLYRPNPFIATQGNVSLSPAIESDGSTLPLRVKLLEVRDKSTGKPLDSNDLAPREVTTYTAAVLPTDNTLELLNKKLSRSMVRPFSINELGGRIQLTTASEYMDTGRYEFDVEVSNVRGKKVLNSIGQVQLNPKIYHEVLRNTLSSSPANLEADFQDVPGGLPLTIERIPTGPNKIIIKFMDKNGAFFNPAQGEIIIRGDRNHFKLLDPYYPEVKTDTALVFEYPNVPSFPIFSNNGEWSSYYRIPYSKNELGRNLNATFGVRFFSGGTWILTMKLGVARKS